MRVERGSKVVCMTGEKTFACGTMLVASSLIQLNERRCRTLRRILSHALKHSSFEVCFVKFLCMGLHAFHWPFNVYQVQRDWSYSYVVWIDVMT
jgi:hypothetical protein